MKPYLKPLIPKNRKGSEFDIIFMMGLGLTLVLMFLLSTKMIDTFKYKMEGKLNNTAVGQTTFRVASLRVVPMFDNLFALIFVGLIMISFISALFIRTHPVFFIISLFVIAIALVLAALFSRVSDNFTDSPLGRYQSVDAPFTKLNFIMDNLPYIVLGMSIMLLILLYSFGRNVLFS